MAASKQKIEYYRCMTCGLLLTDKIIEQGICAGHKMRLAADGSFFEWLLIKLRLYERFTIWRLKKK